MREVVKHIITIDEVGIFNDKDELLSVVYDVNIENDVELILFRCLDKTELKLKLIKYNILESDKLFKQVV
jgi:hypothetical protein